MKDFDQDRTPPLDEDERTFKLAGETFTLRPRVRPEVLIPASKITSASLIEDDVAHIDESIKAFLDEDGVARYEALRARDDDPVAYHDLLAVLQWAVEASTGRPTVQPTPSGNGLSGNGTASTEEASSRVAQVLPA